jgi:ribonuclease E
MANKMIIDASHPEETRVVVLRGSRVEEFDFEAANKKPLRGNIYLAKVTRVEPSLQAAFIDYGGNRHGFLAFSEIHPDYYQIPVADRQALLEEEARSHRDDEEDARSDRRSRRHRKPRQSESEMRARGDEQVSELATNSEARNDGDAPSAANEDVASRGETDAEAIAREEGEGGPPEPMTAPGSAEHAQRSADEGAKHIDAAQTSDETAVVEQIHGQPESVDNSGAFSQAGESHDSHDDDDDDHEVTTLDGGAEETAPRARAPRGDDEGEPVEHVGGDALEEVPRRAPRMRRQYKIQEVIKRRQILLVQVVKEERGNKGAALTTYLSLAGRYSVLMPNTARGGGISRKITNSIDRSRLKSIAEELEVPEGMGVILRTAGAARTKAEVKRDFEYLLRMWETVRELTLSSSAPTLVYEEGSLIKRAIRDLYNKDVEEIVVAGDAGYREAREFMRLLMPSHAKNVQLYRDVQPVFAKSGVEAQLDAMFSNQVTLKSGGYIVINQTEALVAIDVNSGRSTREHNIEDTAVRTNLEAADEVARQLRLRDLAGLIVVDFIDMEEGRNNRAVERRIKDALKNDRARIQVGRISHFGLLEMSRQRIRTGVLEGSTVICPHCAGAGVVRSTSSVALHVLRVVEDALIKSASHDIAVRTRTEVALYILNQKRSHLRDIERRFGVNVTVGADDSLSGSTYHVLERGEPATGVRAPEQAVEHDAASSALDAEDEADFLVEEENEEQADIAPGIDEPESQERSDRPAHRRATQGEAPGEEGEAGRRRRRRRRRRGGERSAGDVLISGDSPQPTDAGLEILAEIGGDFPAPASGFADSEGSAAEGKAQGGGEASGARERPRRTRRGRDRRPGSRTPVEAEAAERPRPSDETGGSGEPADPWPVLSGETQDRTPEAAAAPPVEHAAQPAAVEPKKERIAPKAAAPETQISPVADDPDRPRRSGWWQRAKASIVGE